MIKDCLPKEAVGVPYRMLLKIRASEVPRTKAKDVEFFTVPNFQDGYSQFRPALGLNDLSETQDASVNVSESISCIVTDAEWYCEFMRFKFVPRK